MEHHHFKVGQLVTIEPCAGAADHADAARRYKIQCLLPSIDGGSMYRIKSIMETEPRMVSESECRIADSTL